MNDVTDQWVRVVARALADDRRVMLVGDSFAALSELAACAVKELVVVSALADPDAPAGQTESGAPLKMRADWRERASSKDLVVDPEGVAPPEEVVRVLKKQGLYLTGCLNPATSSFAQVRPLEAFLFARFGLSAEPSTRLTEIGPVIYLAGNVLPELPESLGFAPDYESLGTYLPQLQSAQGLADALRDELDELEAQVADERDARAEAEAQAADRALLAVQVAELKAALAEQERQALAQEAALKAALEAASQAEAARAALADELTRQEVEFESHRRELAERRVADRRIERVEARYDEAKASLVAELTEARERLRALAEPADELASLVATRDALKALCGRLKDQLYEMAVALVQWPADSLPPPVSESAAMDGWLTEVQAAIARKTKAAPTAPTQDGAVSKRERALTAEVLLLRARLEELSKPALVAPAEIPEELVARVAALEATLGAEVSLREAERATRERALRAAELARLEVSELKVAVDNARRDASRARLAQAAADDEIRRLRVELTLRDAHTTDLSEMVQAHARMYGVLVESLNEAEERVEEAETNRRLADESLRLLKAELERARA